MKLRISECFYFLLLERKWIINMEESKKHERGPKFSTVNEYHKDEYFICPYGKGWESHHAKRGFLKQGAHPN